MGKVKVQITMSLDGFVAGPNPTVEDPLGDGGEQLHEWAIALEVWRRAHGMEGGEVNASTSILEATQENVGAYVMGRNMFGGGPGPWGDDWKGWWGDDPPFHAPVFVVTHHEREPLPMQGGTTFTFVTAGVEAAIAGAVEAAGDADVLVSGGASAVQQSLAAGLVDELTVSVAPILLGDGTRLFVDGAEAARLDPLGVVDAPGVAHLMYRIAR
jgi:dihydrofolate reductase